MTATQRCNVRGGQGSRGSKPLCMRMRGIGDTQIIRSYTYGIGSYAYSRPQATSNSADFLGAMGANASCKRKKFSECIAHRSYWICGNFRRNSLSLSTEISCHTKKVLTDGRPDG